MVELAPSLDDLVASILEADRYRQAPRKAWHRSLVQRATSPRCAYCQVQLAPTDKSSAVLSYLVPVEPGGPTNELNRMLSCRSCARSKGTSDIISWGADLPGGVLAPLLDRRQSVLALSANHLTPTRAGAPVDALLDCLRQRWSHPRFRVHAVQGDATSWFAWTPRCGCALSREMAMGLLRHRFQAKLHPHPSASLLSLETPLFLDAVWELIDLHAMVQPLQVPGLPVSPAPTGDWRTHWHTWLNTLSDLRRRRNFLAPRAPYQRAVSGHLDAIRKRRQRQAQTRIAATDDWRQARADLDDLKARVVAGHAHDPSPVEWIELERDVLERYERIIEAGGPLSPREVGARQPRVSPRQLCK